MQKRYYSKILLIFLAAIGIASFFIFNNYISISYDSYSLNSVLDHYGFTSPNQKQAIQNLFQHSSIIDKNEKLIDAFPSKQTKNELKLDIIHMIEETQKKFVVRTGKQERWEVEEQEWVRKNKNEIFLDLKTLGFIDAIEPKQKIIDAICILGATLSTMKNRIRYANSLVQLGLKTRSVILLSGERYVIKDIDGTEEELARIAKFFKLQNWFDLTETHLIQYEYNNSSLYDINITTHVIHQPKANLPRPTTKTTILELVEWLKNHEEIRNIIFISNQPYVRYQKAIIDQTFKQKKVNIKYEVVGDKVKDNENIQEIIGGLGSYLWADSPRILSDINI